MTAPPTRPTLKLLLIADSDSHGNCIFVISHVDLDLIWILYDRFYYVLESSQCVRNFSTALSHYSSSFGFSDSVTSSDASSATSSATSSDASSATSSATSSDASSATSSDASMGADFFSG